MPGGYGVNGGWRRFSAFEAFAVFDVVLALAAVMALAPSCSRRTQQTPCGALALAS